MSQNNDHNQTETNELDDVLAEGVSALKKEALTESDFQEMEKNLQRVIMAKVIREESKVEVSQPQPIKLFDWLKLKLSSVASGQSMRLAGSMGAVMAVSLTLLFMSAPSQSVFAAVLSEMRQVSSMFYSSRIENNGQHLMDIKVYHREPGQLRVETLPLGEAKEGAVINVMDLENGNGVIFFPVLKFATPFNFDTANPSSSPEDDPLYWYQQLQNYQGEPTEYLESKVIDGIVVEGFVIRETGANITVWADSNSHLPVRIVVTLDEVNGQVPFGMVADLKYNQIFDDSLFSLEIAEGYNISVEDADHQ
jgi:outer membrane lipoprotein-sorting protein